MGAGYCIVDWLELTLDKVIEPYVNMFELPLPEGSVAAYSLT